MTPMRRKVKSHFEHVEELDYRSPDEDAWYTVRLLIIEKSLGVMYTVLDEAHDGSYDFDQFQSMEEIDELCGRFRPAVEQLQDSQCGLVTEGMVVVASLEFSNGALAFYDASVDSVSRLEHRKKKVTGKENNCTCLFNVTWKHGPEMGKLCTVRTKNICLIKDHSVESSVLKDFIERARNSLGERLAQLAIRGPSIARRPKPITGASPFGNTSDCITISSSSSDSSPHDHEARDRSLAEEEVASEEQSSRVDANDQVATLKARIVEIEEQARVASAQEKEKFESEMKVRIAEMEKQLAASALEKEKLESEMRATIAEMEEQARAASASEKEQFELQMTAKIAEMEEQARATSSVVEKQKAELEMKVEDLQERLANRDLTLEQDKERYEGMLQELHGKLAHANAQSQILEGQMRVARADREQAIIAWYEMEARLKGKRNKGGKSASNWQLQIPKHLSLPPSETVLDTIRISPAFGPFRSQIVNEIRINLMTDDVLWTSRMLNRCKSANIAPSDVWKFALAHPNEQNPDRLQAARGFVSEVRNKAKRMRLEQHDDDSIANELTEFTSNHPFMKNP